MALQVDVWMINLSQAQALRRVVRVVGADLDRELVLTALPNAVFLTQIYHESKVHDVGLVGEVNLGVSRDI